MQLNVSNGVLQFMVSDFTGHASPELLARVRSAAAAICGAGLPVDVAPLPPNDPRGSLEDLGFIVPRQDKQIVDFTEQDQDTYAARLPRLVQGSADGIPIVDGFTGTSILCTTTCGRDAPVTCFLPVYDRLYLKMPPTKPDENSTEAYLKEHFGLGEKEFFTYCERGKIVPIFKFSLGVYPSALAHRFLDDLSLAMVTPRELDFIAARYAWKTAEHIRVLREDRTLSAAVYERLRELQARRPQGAAERLMIEVLGSALSVATSFEGTMWHKGHNLVGSFSPAALLVRMAHINFDPKDEALVSLDTMMTADTVALSQAFGASTYDGMNIHPNILELVMKFFGDDEALSIGKGKQVKQLVEAFDLAYCEGVSIDEYLDLFDRAETRRVRALISDLLAKYGTPNKQQELREAVRLLNDEVRKLSKRDILRADVDVVGDLASAGKAAIGSSMLANVFVNALGLKTIKVAGAQMFDALVEDTKLGDTLDAVRGRINGTPAAAVRLFRIRSRLRDSKKS